MRDDPIRTDATIRFRFLTPEEGGRRDPIVYEYRHLCRTPGQPRGEFWSTFVYREGRTLEPGQSYDLSVAFVADTLVLSILKTGDAIELWEGPVKKVADGVVLSVRA